MQDLERVVGPTWPESAQNRSLAKKNLALSEPQIFSRIWRVGRADLAMRPGRRIMKQILHVNLSLPYFL